MDEVFNKHTTREKRKHETSHDDFREHKRVRIENVSLITDSPQLWADKYKPVNLDDFIGNKKTVDSLCTWLNEWNCKPNQANTKSKKESVVKCALLFGPSGVGKTTVAQLVSEKIGYTPVYTFSSVSRDKDTMNKLMQGTKSSSIKNFFTGGSTEHLSIKNIMIVDDVDCFTSSDRGGLNEVIKNIKGSKTPFVFICNDKYDRKLKSLTSHCVDFRFTRPTAQQILPRIKYVLRQEGIVTNDRFVLDVIESTNGDVRQCLNTLQWIFSKRTTVTTTTLGILESTKKDVGFSLFDSSARIFDNKETFDARLSVYFEDTSLIPLMVQENYIRIDLKSKLEDLAEASDYISIGDVYDTMMRKEQLWGLSPVNGMFSSIFPCYKVNTSKTHVKFPEWMGKNSSMLKHERINRRLHERLWSKCRLSASELRAGYLETLAKKLVEPLVGLGEGGIEPIIESMDVYSIDRTEREDMLETSLLQNETIQYKKTIPPQLKTKFTKKYNAIHKQFDKNVTAKINRVDDVDDLDEESNDSINSS